MVSLKEGLERAGERMGIDLSLVGLSSVGMEVNGMGWEVLSGPMLWSIVEEYTCSFSRVMLSINCKVD